MRLYWGQRVDRDQVSGGGGYPVREGMGSECAARGGSGENLVRFENRDSKTCSGLGVGETEESKVTPSYLDGWLGGWLTVTAWGRTDEELAWPTGTPSLVWGLWGLRCCRTSVCSCHVHD